MTKCTEALRLLREVPHAYKCSTYDEGADVPVDDGRCDCHRVAIDAFLADPSACDAEKAVLVAALEDARMLCMNDHAYDNETSQVFEAVQVINRALADTPSAAAALLAQGERLEEALKLLRSVVETRGCPYCGWADGRHPQKDCPYRAALAPREK